MSNMRPRVFLSYTDMNQQVTARRDGALTRMLVGQTSISARRIPRAGMGVVSGLITRKFDLLNLGAALDFVRRYGGKEL
jgi:hypothetical protein